MSVEDNKLLLKTTKDIVLKPNEVLHLDIVLYSKTPIIPDIHELDDPTILVAPHIFHHPHMSIENIIINNQTNKQTIIKADDILCHV